MGRGKIEIKKIENVNSRQVTFSKRRAGLFKKANELAVLCEAEVAVIIFSNTGKLFEFANSSMKKILSRYKKWVETTKGIAGEPEPEPEKPQQPKEADILKEEIENLKLKQLRLLGKDLTGMSSQELHLLERQLNEGLICIKERKEQLLMQELAQCRIQEQRAVLENETLRRQVEELRGFFPLTRSPTTLCIDYQVKKAILLSRKVPEVLIQHAMVGLQRKIQTPPCSWSWGSHMGIAGNERHPMAKLIQAPQTLISASGDLFSPRR